MVSAMAVLTKRVHFMISAMAVLTKRVHFAVSAMAVSSKRGHFMVSAMADASKRGRFSPSAVANERKRRTLAHMYDENPGNGRKQPSHAPVGGVGRKCYGNLSERPLFTNHAAI